MTIFSNDPVNGEYAIDAFLTLGVPPVEHFEFEATELIHDLTVNDVTFDDEAVDFGWEVGVFTPDGVCAGAGVWVGQGPLFIEAYGAQGEVAGFEAGNRFAFMLWDADADEEIAIDATFEEGPEIWNDGGNTVLSLAAFGWVEQAVAMSDGWNMISINVDPVDFYDPDEEFAGPDIPIMFEQLEDEEGDQIIDLLKDESGDFWAPAWNFINIDFWNLTEGYQVKVLEDCEVVMEGNPIPADADIPIGPNWNLIAYFPNYDLDASNPDFYVLSPVIDDIQLAKNGAGQFMTPAWDFSNMPPWTAGQGYQIKSTAEEDIILNYPPEQEMVAFAGSKRENARNWTAPISTGENMSVLINAISGIPTDAGDQIAAYSTTGNLLGVGDVIDGRCGIAIWGDDVSTEMVDGANDGEAFELRFWDADQQVVADLEISLLYTGTPVYSADDFVALDVMVRSAIPEDYYLSGNYPNPFNSVTRLTFGMPEANNIDINVYDVNGRLVQNLVSTTMEAGNHVITWNAENTSAGVYVIRMESGSFSKAQKVMLVK